jgi:TfoX/Sxy family transcriptional regulator of competence genes
MATSKEYKDFILEQLDLLDNITCKAMMGEFLLYYNDVLFGGIYDNRFLIKKTNSNKEYSLAEEIPYKNAKPMYMVENLDDVDYLSNLIKTTCENLK